MTLKIWLETDHHAAFKVAGWAHLRQDGASLSGAVGGERAIDSQRAILAAVVDALKGAAGPVQLLTANREILALPARIAGFQSGEDLPLMNLDLWAAVTTALKTVTLTAAANTPKTPTAFCAAWADLGRDKAKAQGTFRAAIPKPNLAKAGL